MSSPFPFAGRLRKIPGIAWRSHIEPLDGGGYRPPVVSGLPAWHLAVIDQGDVIDVAAIPDAEPLRVYTLRGAAVFMGHENYDRADLLGEPLRLFRDPRAWWLDGIDAAAVVDWHLAPPLLAGLSEIILDDTEHADLVHDRLLPWAKTMPRLFIASTERAEA